MLHNDEARRTGSETGAVEQEAEIPVMLFDREISTREPLPAFSHRVGANLHCFRRHAVFLVDENSNQYIAVPVHYSATNSQGMSPESESRFWIKTCVKEA